MLYTSVIRTIPDHAKKLCHSFVSVYINQHLTEKCSFRKNVAALLKQNTDQ